MEALDTYRRTRETLVEELGIEPSRALQELERAILTHDPSLELERRSPSEPERSILVLPSTDDGLDAILQVAEPLGRLPGRELIIARLLVDPRELAHAASELNSRCAGLGRDARAAAFTTLEPTRDAVRLASAYDVDLVLLEAPPALAAEPVPDDLGAIFERAPADVAVLAGSVDLVEGDGFYVPFGGNEHDWAALELAAWLASAVAAPLRLVGASATARGGRRDASRLLADASLAVQRVVGVQAQPLLVEPNEEALAAAVEPATLVVVGVSPRWRRDGIGTARRALVRRGRPPTLVVHRGARPGGLAPAQSRTRFTWTLAAAAV